VISWQCGDNNPFAPETRDDNEVWIQNRQFVPQTLTVAKGTTVKWTNKDDDFHTVDHGKEKEPDPNPEFNLTVLVGGSATHTFTKTGTFDYYCGRHGETGTIVVQ
jgi:plastocyanin